ncbi:DUF2721 domain-containing protein [Gammaproteobacteria bacterium]|nr:DUF2721 domain-containing protein [Gammaproteobacteria bacterium]
MQEYLSISEIMQTAVTPVFLLAGIGALLNVMTGRLGRIIDRLRYLESYLALINAHDQEIILLSRKRLIFRTRFINIAIFLCTFSALIVCIVIGSLFVGGIYKILLDSFVSFAFILCMLCLILSLILLIFEILFATRTSRKKILAPEAIISKYLHRQEK